MNRGKGNLILEVSVSTVHVEVGRKSIDSGCDRAGLPNVVVAEDPPLRWRHFIHLVLEPRLHHLPSFAALDGKEVEADLEIQIEAIRKFKRPKEGTWPAQRGRSMAPSLEGDKAWA